MTRSAHMIAVVLPLALAACGSELDPADSAATGPASETAVDPARTGPTDDPTRAEPRPDADRGETGARAVLLDLARAIELGRFDQAYAMLGEADRKRWSRADFAGFFTGLEKITVAVPGGTMEGAAGSSYYMVPATITATDTAGVPVRYQGEIVLRRVNDVPGATPEQLRWHIEHVELDRTD